MKALQALLITGTIMIVTLSASFKTSSTAPDTPTTVPIAVVATSRDLGDQGVLVVLFTKSNNFEGGSYQYLLVSADRARVERKGGYAEVGGPYGRGTTFLDVFMPSGEEVNTVTYVVPWDAYFARLGRNVGGGGGEFQLLGLPSIKASGGEPLKAHLSGSAKDKNETVELTDGKQVWRYVWDEPELRWRHVEGPFTGSITRIASPAATRAPTTAPDE